MADPSQKAPHAPGYVPTPRYTQEDWDEVSDNPAWTAEDFANAKPFAEVFPDLAKKMAQKKVATSIRLDADVIAALRATGPRWQTRINDLLREALRSRSLGSRLSRALGPKRVKAPVAKRAKSV
jgi:uncharacterized protein (DUF4415 family)